MAMAVAMHTGPGHGHGDGHGQNSNQNLRKKYLEGFEFESCLSNTEKQMKRERYRPGCLKASKQAKVLLLLSLAVCLLLLASGLYRLAATLRTS